MKQLSQSAFPQIGSTQQPRRLELYSHPVSKGLSSEYNNNNVFYLYKKKLDSTLVIIVIEAKIKGRT
jgi:hypothetical protein